MKSSKLLIIQPIFIVLALTVFLGCQTDGDKSSGRNDFKLSQQFEDYWYAGSAEITRYELSQARYGEQRDGDAVLIFVTEDFLTDRQVKREDYSREYDNSASVLKLNYTKNFNTGIYPYSIMSSIFTPVNRAEFPRTLKVTTTVQEWCGHVFMQLNHRRNKYEVSSYSYFQQEGDKSYKIDDVYLEDGVWTTVRIAPETLPEGNISMIPGTVSTRLRHKHLEPLQARAAKERFQEGGVDMINYTISYPEDGRRLSIRFTEEFPHSIEYFEEEYVDGFGDSARQRLTTARRTHRIMEPYWQQNSNADEVLRRDLGLGGR
jgi:hypothetical protein